VTASHSLFPIPATQYVGGIEHACMHLIYSRFFHKVLRDMGLVKSDEPFASLLTQGMVTLGGTAMSKSKGNVVDPNSVIQKYGADTCRLFIMFAAPPTQQLEWSDTQVEGIWRFLNRVWRLAIAFTEGDDARAPKRTFDESSKTVSTEELVRLTHATIQAVTHDIENEFGFNTAISRVMELVNALYLYPNVTDAHARTAVETVVQLLQPFAPHMTEELWNKLGHKELLVKSPWPKADTSKLVSKSVEIVVQVNGKLREKLTVASSSKEEDVKSLALASLQKRGLDVVAARVIYVPNKLVNFVTGKN
jgi:leucyl-tRNA synthetase